MKQRRSALDEAFAYQRHLWRRALAARASRQLVVRAGTLASLGGLSAVNALLAACGAEASAQREVVGQSAAGSYRYSRYPLVDKYHWRRYTWGGTPYLGGTIVSPDSPPNNFDLLRVSGNAFHGYTHNLLMRLTGDPGGLMGTPSDLDRLEFVPDLAESVQHSPDFATWTVRIHRGVHFQDIPPVNGREVTADDVVFSYQVLKERSVSGEPLSIFERIEPLDRYTVRFTLKQPVLWVPAVLANPTYYIFAREHFEDKELWNNQAIGTGPFVVTYSKFRDRFELAPHSDFFQRDVAGRRLPYVAAVKGFFFADAAAALAAFRTGQIDAYSAKDLDEFEQVLATNPDVGVVVQHLSTQTLSGYTIQHHNPILADLRVRRALSMAIDRDGIIQNLFRGAGAKENPLAFDFFGETEPLDGPALGPYMAYNPQEARQLLQAAGYGAGLELELVTAGAPTDLDLLVRDYWAQVGVRLVFREVESTVKATIEKDKSFKDLLQGIRLSGADAAVAVPAAFGPGSPENRGNINDPVINELIPRVLYSLDPDERNRVVRQIVDRALDQVLNIYLVGAHNFHIWQPWLHNYFFRNRASPTGRGRWTHQLMWLDERAPADRAGRRAT